MSVKKNIIQVFEWETLKVHGDRFTATQFDSLVKWQDSQDKPYFNVHHKRITFCQWVGVIQVGRLVIEVLPKAGKGSGDRSEDINRWKNVLIGMLRKTSKLKLRTSENTDLSTHNQSLFDLYYQSFLEEVETLIHRGLVKKYRRDDRNRTALKGKLNFQKQTSMNLVHKERFYTEAFEYDRQNDWNEILFSAIKITGRHVQSGRLCSLAKNLELNFPDWPDRKFDSNSFTKLVYNRKTEGYENAINLAKLIIMQLNPQVSSGHERVMAILFDMNTLWEEWLLAVYRSSYRDRSDVTILGKKQKVFWTESLGYGTKRIESDILVEVEGRIVILDAKWKLPKNKQPADADLKQMYVYNTMWGSQEAWLIYPMTSDNEDSVGGYYSLADPLFSEFSAGTLGMGYINIFNDNKLITELKLPVLQ